MPKSADIEPGPLTRRQFIVSASLAVGGLALGIVSAEAGSDAPAGGELSAWLEIAADDTVTIRSPTPEIGNGSMTQVAMNVAEELACDWSRVKVDFCSIQRDYL